MDRMQVRSVEAAIVMCAATREHGRCREMVGGTPRLAFASVCRAVTTCRNDVAEARTLLREANLLIGARLRFHLLHFATLSARADSRLEQFAWGISLERERV